MLNQKEWVLPPKSSILIGFSIMFTIHFGVPLFLETYISNFWGVPSCKTRKKKKEKKKTKVDFQEWSMVVYWRMQPWPSDYISEESEWNLITFCRTCMGCWYFCLIQNYLRNGESPEWFTSKWIPDLPFVFVVGIKRFFFVFRSTCLKAERPLKRSRISLILTQPMDDLTKS